MAYVNNERQSCRPKAVNLAAKGILIFFLTFSLIKLFRLGFFSEPSHLNLENTLGSKASRTASPIITTVKSVKAKATDGAIIR